MKRQKTVESNGKITITTSEERYPYASDILMRNGFLIIFLNMALGLLPITIWGSRVKYFKCSISQLYTILFCLCFIILSAIFVPLSFFPRNDQTASSMTSLVILVVMGVSHVLGYIVLLLRGHVVAKRMPAIWTQLCKLVQISVIDVYGTECDLFKEVKSFGRWAVSEFIFVISISLGSILIVSVTYSLVLSYGLTYYKLYLIWPPLSDGRTTTMYENFQKGTYRAAYFVWQVCSSSHVLVSMLLCYIVIMIKACLKSLNRQIYEFSDAKGRNKATGIIIPKVKFRLHSGGSERDGSSMMSRSEREMIIGKLNLVKRSVMIIEDLLGTVSRLFGVSLIVEALILISAGTVNTFNFFSSFRKPATNYSSEDAEALPSPNDIMRVSVPGEDQWIMLLMTIFLHFLFVFKLACQVNKMVIESGKSIQLLKQATFNHLPSDIQEKVQELKQDLATTNMCLTASNFFQINKFLITSITSQIATYVIVLLQFAQQEIGTQQPPDTEINY